MGRPYYSILKKFYKTTPAHVCADVAANDNQCAIRLSRAFVGAKIPLTNFTWTKCIDGYARGAQDFGAWMLQQYGVYDRGWANPGSRPAYLAQKYGIIMFANIPSFPQGQGHVDLWDGSGSLCGTGACNYWSANPIWFWELEYGPSVIPAAEMEHDILQPPLVDTGFCGATLYSNYTLDRALVLLKELTRNGFEVQGNNPWDVNTGTHRVRLRGSLDENSGVLTVIVTDKKDYVRCEQIWDRISPIIEGIPQTGRSA
jgi:hypothetical protein